MNPRFGTASWLFGVARRPCAGIGARFSWVLPLVVATLLVLSTCPVRGAASLEASLEVLRAVGPEGRGNLEAKRAWGQVAAAEAAALPAVLASMDGADPLALNWLRAAVDSIVDRTAQHSQALPLAELGEFLLDTSHHPRARRLAFELIARADPATAERLVPGMLNDPSLELRRDAVQRLMNQAAAQPQSESGRAAASILYRQALGAARDVDQMDGIAEQLKKLGRPIDLPRVFGFLLDWMVVGPFDNTDRTGFGKVFAPEIRVDLSASYDGKKGAVRWARLASTHDHGMVDLNKPLGALKEVTGYAFTEFFSHAARAGELRLGCKNGWKAWWNGEYLFGRDEYHRGAQIDQYRMPIQIQAGRNTLLLKICQNEQVEDWTVEWEFQARVCDPIGNALHSVRPPFAAAAAASAQ